MTTIVECHTSRSAPAIDGVRGFTVVWADRLSTALLCGRIFRFLSDHGRNVNCWDNLPYISDVVPHFSRARAAILSIWARHIRALALPDAATNSRRVSGIGSIGPRYLARELPPMLLYEQLIVGRISHLVFEQGPCCEWLARLR
jgi:hypothetical protein